MSHWVMIPALDCSTFPRLESRVTVTALQPAGFLFPTQMGLLSFPPFCVASMVTTAVFLWLQIHLSRTLQGAGSHRLLVLSPFCLDLLPRPGELGNLS